MATRSEIARKLRAVNNQISSQHRVIESYIEKIDRLQVAKNRLEDEKGEIKTLQKQLKLNNCAGDVQWRGKSKSDFDQKVNGDVKEAGNTFKSQVGDMISAIWWEIVKLKAEKVKEDLTLDGLYFKRKSLQLQYALAFD